MRKDFYDSLEVDNPDLREGGLFGRLPNLIALALSGAGWARQLGSIDPNIVTSREALAPCRCCAPTTGRPCAAAIRRSAAWSFRSAAGRGAC